MLGASSAVCCHDRGAGHVVNADLAALEAPALWETAVSHLDALRHDPGRAVVGVAADVSAAPWTRVLRGKSVGILLEFEGGVRGVYSVS